MCILTFPALAAEIAAAALPLSSFACLVAVDGPSGAGKSTFAKQLAVALGGAPVIEIDDFLSWNDLTGWWPRLEEQVLVPLAAGHEAVYQQRDWTRDPLGAALGDWRTVVPAPVVILEGVRSSRQAVVERLAFRVWVDAPARVRLRRGLVRDGQGMQARWVDWMQREDAFFSYDGTRSRADLVVDGNPAKAPAPGAVRTRPTA